MWSAVLFFYWDKGLRELLMFMWHCVTTGTVVTIIWHFGNRDTSLWNTVANNRHFESSDDMGELKVCNIKKICTNIPCFPFVSYRQDLNKKKFAILFYRQFCGWGFWLVFIWHKDGITYPVIRWSVPSILCACCCPALPHNNSRRQKWKSKEERTGKREVMTCKTRWLSNYLANKFSILINWIFWDLANFNWYQLLKS